MSISTYILYDVNKKTLAMYQYEEVLDAIYYQHARVPTEEQVKEYLTSKKSKTNQKISFLFKDSVKKGIQNIKDEISKIDYKVPLYDEYTHNLFIINRSNVYTRVVHQHYRFPTDMIIELFQRRLQKLEGYKKESSIKKSLKDIQQPAFEQTKLTKTVLREREYRKLNLMLDFIQQFNMEILENTYIQVFYYYSNKVGKDITVCLRPSFIPYFKHIHPFYTRSELINLGLNMQIIKESKMFYDQKKISDLCKKIKQNDISSKIILKHHKHIIRQDKIGVIQYYTLQGSFFLNQYLRGSTKGYQNQVYEEKIRSLYDLILLAPPFDKSYTVYRFIKDDSYLKHLKVGDEYVDNSFISTTRDPFYKPDDYQFGFILLKIKIPKDQSGVALCIETVSNFPKEEEIIFSPMTVLKLENVDSNVPYFHPDEKYQGQIKTRYEFTYVRKEQLVFPKYKPIESDDTVINFLTVESYNSYSLKEEITKFQNRYVNELYQFKTKIGNIVYTMIIDTFDSTSAYKDYYASKTNNGYCIYTFIGDYIGVTIELVEDTDGRAMYVNYYFRHSTVPSKNQIDENNLVEFIGAVAVYFNIDTVLIYATYKSCNCIKNDGKECEGGNYVEDFYEYFKFKTKRYNTVGIKTGFDYEQLNLLYTAHPNTVLSKDDRDELYQVYVRIYEPMFPKENHTIAKFYIWLVETHCQYTKYLVEKMYRLYKEDNPFEKDYYLMDSLNFIKGKHLLSYDKLEKKKLTVKNSVKIKQPPKNRYRLQQDPRRSTSNRTQSTRT